MTGLGQNRTPSNCINGMLERQAAPTFAPGATN